jgi:hypothetical protein
MSLEDVLKGASVPAVLIGIGLVAAAPILLRGVSDGSRPLAKVLLHKYLDMVEKFQELSAETQEQWRDLLAEVQAERQASQQADVASAAEPTVKSHM